MSGYHLTEKDRSNLLLAMTLDPDLSDLGRRVGALIALQYLNRKTGYAWPSAERMAEDLGTTRRSVVRVMSQLEGRYFRVDRERTPGRGRVNWYYPIIPENVTVRSLLEQPAIQTEYVTAPSENVTVASRNSDRADTRTPEGNSLREPPREGALEQIPVQVVLAGLNRLKAVGFEEDADEVERVFLSARRKRLDEGMGLNPIEEDFPRFVESMVRWKALTDEREKNLAKGKPKKGG